MDRYLPSTLHLRDPPDLCSTSRNVGVVRMTRQYTPRQSTFRIRLAALAEERGVDRIASDYGRSRETVRRWLRGTQRPSARVQRSVVRRGRRITGPARRVRDPRTGRISFRVTSMRGARATEVLRQRRSERRRVAIEEARTPRQVAIAEGMPEGLTEEEEAYLEDELAQLLIDDALGYDTSERWEAFRRRYGAIYG